jgi:heme exporter protein A
MALPPEPLTSDAPLPVHARGLQRRYGSLRALDNVDLSLARGEFLTIFGPNGAGKSTLLKVLASLVRPTGGALAVFGLDPRAFPDQVKRRLGLIAHNGFLYGGLTARDNLIFYARLYDVADAAARAEAMLHEVGLADRADDMVRTFSRGMQQRLCIARALLHDPDLVLLDEPYTGLDQHASRLLRGILEQVRGRGRSVVMVTHHLEEGLGVSTRVAIMTRGRLAWESAAASLTRDAMERTYLDVVGGAP